VNAISEVYQTHLEELQFCWEQLHVLSVSPDVMERDLSAWRDRFRAHLDGLMVVSEEEAMAFLEPKLEDPTTSFAAAYALLQRRSEQGNAAVLSVFHEAQDEQLDGLCAALCHSPIDDRIVRVLSDDLENSPASIAAPAAEVLAFHGRLDRNHPRLQQLVAEEDPRIRQRAWRVRALAAV
jgi:hypothetical protein